MSERTVEDGVHRSPPPVDGLEPDDVVLDVPGAYASVRLARLVAAGMAATAGFDLEQMDDVRIAVSEACGIVIDQRPGGRLLVRYRAAGDAVRISVTAMGGDAPEGGQEPPDLSGDILDVVTDAWRLDVTDGATSVHLDTRREGPA